MATAEFAVAIPAVMLIATLALAALSTALDTVRCVDAARAVARLVARGDAPAAALEQGRRLAPTGAAFTLTGTATTVEVRVVGRQASGLRWLGSPFRPSGDAVASREDALAGAGE
jgi:hypothetical protein